MLAKRWFEGVKDAVVPVYETVPATGSSPCFKVNVDVPIVRGFIASLNVAVTILLRVTSVASFDGSVEITVGERLATLSSSFEHAVIKTTVAIAKVDNRFFNFI